MIVKKIHTKKATCKIQQVDVFFRKEAPVIKRSVSTKLWSVAKSGSSTLATYFLLFITSAIAEVTK
jgi:hypothetical protein